MLGAENNEKANVNGSFPQGIGNLAEMEESSRKLGLIGPKRNFTEVKYIVDKVVLCKVFFFNPPFSLYLRIIRVCQVALNHVHYNQSRFGRSVSYKPYLFFILFPSLFS